MYRGASLSCPACGGSLEYAKVSLPVHGCLACGGMWLGPEAAMHVLQGHGGALESEVVDSDQRTSLNPTSEPVVPDTAIRQCPTCALDMGSLMVGDTRVDSCPTHGTWFDRLEVTRITKKIGALRKDAKRREAEAGLPSLDDFVNDTIKLAEGSAKFLGELWSWLASAAKHNVTCKCSECTRPTW